MRNPWILTVFFILVMSSLNLVIPPISQLPSQAEINLNSNGVDSWATIVKPEYTIYYSHIKYVNESIYFGGRFYSEEYIPSIYITKYDSSGTKQWERICATPYPNPNTYEFEVDTEENIYILATSKPPNSPERIFLLKYSSLGNLLWSKIINSSRTCYVKSMKLDVNDSIYISGRVSNYTDSYEFLHKLDGSGDILWKCKLNNTIKKLQIDSQNNIYGYGQRFLVKYNSSGSKIWLKEWEETDDYTYIDSIELDSDDNIILIGQTMYSSNYSFIYWIMRYNSSGEFQNKLSFKSYSSSYYYFYTWFFGDNFYVYNTYDHYSTSFPCLLKYDNDFNLKWNISLIEHFIPPYANILDVTLGVDSQENIFLLYNNHRTEYLGERGQEEYNAEDILILKLNSSGDIQSKYFWGGSYHDIPITSYIDPHDNLYLLSLSVYRDVWNIYRDRIVIVKNPEVNGRPPQMVFFGFNFYDYYIFSLMGFVSLISIILLGSIIVPKIRKQTRGY